MDLPFVSLIVPAKDAENSILKCLNATHSLDYPSKKLDVIIVAGKSKDKTVSIVEQFCKKNQSRRFKIIPDSLNLGGGNAINKGVNASKGEIIALTNADCFVEPSWLKNLVSEFDVGMWGCCGSRKNRQQFKSFAKNNRARNGKQIFPLFKIYVCPPRFKPCLAT